MRILHALEKRPYIIILLLVALVSVHSLKNSFLFIDDIDLIVDNPKLNLSLEEIAAIFSKPLGQIYDIADYPGKFVYYRPALNLFYILNAGIWGMNPVGFHLNNLFLHLMTTIFIYRIGLLLFNKDMLFALMAASLFSVHPVHNELIARVAMNENLLAFFVVTSLYYYLKDNKKISLAAFALALLAKESAVMLPFFYFILEIREYDFKKSLTAVAPFLATLGIYLVARTIVVGMPEGVQMNSWTVLVACSALADYLRLLFVPYPLNIYYPYYPVWKLTSPFQIDILMSVSVCLFLVYALWKWRNNRLLFLLLTGTVIMLFPVLFNANQLILEFERVYIAERQLYVPSIFFSLLIAGIIMKYPDIQAKKYLISGFFAVIPIFILTTISASDVWENDDEFKSRFIRDHESTLLAHKYRGEILFKQGDLDGALIEFKAALPSADSRSVEQIAAKTAGGKKFKDFANLLDCYDLAAYQPGFAEVHFDMGQVYLAKNNTECAISKFKTALALQPHFQEARIRLAEAYSKNGNLRDARREFQLALKDIHKIR